MKEFYAWEEAARLMYPIEGDQHVKKRSTSKIRPDTANRRSGISRERRDNLSRLSPENTRNCEKHTQSEALLWSPKKGHKQVQELR